MGFGLVELENAWSQHPLGKNRAAGGRRALKGFSYQVAVSIDRFVELIEGPDGAGAEVSFEGLSDLSTIEGGLAYVVQVKTTLTKGSAIDAAEEALAVDRFLEDDFPDVRGSTRFRVVCQRQRGVVDPRALEATDLSLDPGETDRWQELRERMLAPEVRASPRAELGARLFARYDDPLALASRLSGEAFDGLEKDQSPAKITERMIAALDSARREPLSEAPGQLLRPQSFVGSASGSRILLGQRPTVRQVAEGYFMSRDDRVEPVATRVAELLEEEGGDHLPIHWLAGASGAGKSVLMLQTLQRLAEDEGVVVHLVSHLPHELEAALRYWGDAKDERVVIAIDDLYAPAHRESSAWEQLIALGLHVESTGRVVVLTTGPDEYLRSFRQMAAGEGAFAVSETSVGDLSTAERRAFGQWYESRTATKTSSPSDAVFVEAAFRAEIERAGSADLGEFAQRFANRAKAADALDPVLSTLALNRLGFGAPSCLFADRRGELDRLIGEGVAEIETGEGLEVIRLYHQRLAATLYDALFDEEQVEQRARDLVRGFEGLMPSVSQANALLRSLKRQEDRFRVRFIEYAWEAIWSAYPEGAPVGLVVPWLFAALSARVPLAPYAVKLMEWGFADSTRSTGTEAVWKILGRNCPELRDDLAAEGRGWLERHHDDPMWGAVFQVSVRGGVDRPGFLDLGIPWLESHPDHPDWGLVFSEIVKERPESRRLAVSALERAPLGPFDGTIWAEAFEHSQNPRLVLGQVTRRTCRAPTQRLVVEGVRYIVERTGDDGVGSVRWGLEQERESPQWPKAMLSLLAATPRKQPLAAALRAAGIGWLQDHADDPMWPAIWHSLFLASLSAIGQKRRLVTLGCEWLDSHQFERHWVNIVNRLLVDSPAIGASYMKVWLQEHSDRHVWPRLFAKLHLAAADDPEVGEIALNWLADHDPDETGWLGVFIRSWGPDPTGQLVDQGWRRLVSAPPRRWHSSWREVAERRPSDPVVLADAERFLVDNLNAPGWSFMFATLTRDGGSARLLEAGRRWLDRHRSAIGWPFVWAVLVESDPDAPLVEQGEDWLRKHGRRETGKVVRNRLDGLKGD